MTYLSYLKRCKNKFKKHNTKGLAGRGIPEIDMQPVKTKHVSVDFPKCQTTPLYKPSEEPEGSEM